jgi:hypothetical protein
MYIKKRLEMIEFTLWIMIFGLFFVTTSANVLVDNKLVNLSDSSIERGE